MPSFPSNVSPSVTFAAVIAGTDSGAAVVSTTIVEVVGVVVSGAFVELVGSSVGSSTPDRLAGGGEDTKTSLEEPAQPARPAVTTNPTSALDHLDIANLAIRSAPRHSPRQAPCHDRRLGSRPASKIEPDGPLRGARHPSVATAREVRR